MGDHHRLKNESQNEDYTIRCRQTPVLNRTKTYFRKTQNLTYKGNRPKIYQPC